MNSSVCRVMEIGFLTSLRKDGENQSGQLEWGIVKVGVMGRDLVSLIGLLSQQVRVGEKILHSVMGVVWK